MTTAVFIHGVPDTAEVWSEVTRRLGDTRCICPDLPGFGAPIPPEFNCTMDDYAAWVAACVTQVGGPVHLVGHDWGAILVQRVASLHPDLVRTWAVGGGPIDEDYEWHSTAKVWQTPGAGERWWRGKGRLVMGMALAAAGVPLRAAFRARGRIDADMKAAILALYRSAVDVGREWAPDLRNLSADGLVFWGRRDPFCPERYGRKLAERTGARYLGLDCGHWAPLQKPDELAGALRELWAE